MGRHDRRKNKIYRKRMRKKTFVMAVVLIVVLAFGYMKFYHQSTVTQDEIPSWITQDLIYEADPSQRNLRRVNDIVIHYTANPGSTAKANRDYFAQDTTQVNSHFVVGLDGEIIQCVPLYMQSVASNTRNDDTISIEVCHPDSTGEFTLASYNSTVRLTAWLCDTFGISRTNVIRHGDITGKNCPKYFMENPEAWKEFKMYVKKYNFQ